MFCEKCLCKIHQIGNNTIFCIRPERCKLKTIACFALFGFTRLCFFSGIETGSIGIILCVCTVRDNKYLNILIQSAACPETVTLITVDLIESFTNLHATPFQFNMHHRKAIDKYRNIIAVIMPCTLCLSYLILIDNLNKIVVYIILVDQGDILACAVITPENLNMIFLYSACFVGNALILSCNVFAEKVFPFTIRKPVMIQFFKLLS